VVVIAGELATNFAAGRLGEIGHWVLLVCGGYFAAWGLKDVLTTRWPRLGNRGIARHLFRLPVEGRIYLLIMCVLFIGSLLGRSNPLLLVFSCLAGPFILNGALILTMVQRQSVARRLPPRAMVGEPVAVEITLHNRHRLLPAWVVTVGDRVAGAREVLQPEVLFVHLRARQQQSAYYQVELSRRGVYEFGPVIVRSRFPLGVVERGLQSDLPGQLLVYPRLGHLSTGWLRAVRAAQVMQTQLSVVSPTADVFHRLREYRAGDDIRSIHWPTSARRNELMVREFRELRVPAMTVLLDAWRPARPDEADWRRIETACELAATICLRRIQSSRETPLAFAAHGKEYTEWRGGGRGQRPEELLDQLALLVGAPQSDWRRLLAAHRDGEQPETIRLLISTRAAAIREALVNQPGGHEEVLVMGVDPEELRGVFTSGGQEPGVAP
jgi:uncharacterized protein (DUF58 family)